jgi:hypothetical protein
MSQQKISVTFKRVPLTGHYKVTRTANTLSWKPGESYSEKQVEQILRSAPRVNFLFTE